MSKEPKKSKVLKIFKNQGIQKRRNAERNKKKSRNKQKC